MSKKYLNSPLKLKKYPHKSHLFPKEIQALAVVLKKNLTHPLSLTLYTGFRHLKSILAVDSSQ